MWFDIDFITNCIVRGSSIERRGAHAAMETEFREIDELGNWNAVYQVTLTLKDWFCSILDYDVLYIHKDSKEVCFVILIWCLFFDNSDCAASSLTQNKWYNKLTLHRDDLNVSFVNSDQYTDEGDEFIFYERESIAIY